MTAHQHIYDEDSDCIACGHGAFSPDPAPGPPSGRVTRTGEPAAADRPPGKAAAGGSTSPQHDCERRSAAGKPSRQPGTSPGHGAAPGRGRAPRTPAGGASSESSVPSAGLKAMAAAMSEDRGPDSLDAHVRKLCGDLGLLRYHTRDSRGSVRGYPDLTICGLGGVIFRELKAQRGTVRPEQRMWLDALAAAGADAGVWRPEHLLSGKVASELAALAGLRTGAA